MCTWNQRDSFVATEKKTKQRSLEVSQTKLESINCFVSFTDPSIPYQMPGNLDNGIIPNEIKVEENGAFSFW